MSSLVEISSANGCILCSRQFQNRSEHNISIASTRDCVRMCNPYQCAIQSNSRNSFWPRLQQLLSELESMSTPPSVQPFPASLSEQLVVEELVQFSTLCLLLASPKSQELRSRQKFFLATALSRALSQPQTQQHLSLQQHTQMMLLVPQMGTQPNLLLQQLPQQLDQHTQLMLLVPQMGTQPHLILQHHPQQLALALFVV
mmetsp:Transcript_88845/g.139074  ORF Transcript_88845/g.139074 Transcript_88845/m.139074 type:complete len:200 (+) Transcript_88845:1466-2065(+)